MGEDALYIHFFIKALVACSRLMSNKQLIVNVSYGEENGWMCKEDFADFVWVLDPIDGTKSFITGICQHNYWLLCNDYDTFLVSLVVAYNCILIQENPCLEL